MPGAIQEKRDHRFLSPCRPGSALTRHRSGAGIFEKKDRKAFDATEWLAAMCSHVPNPGEQMVRYYGWYSNVSRGKRHKSTGEDCVPNIIESDRAPAECRKSWARLIQKIYEVDPLTCPKCRGTMRIISTIEDQEVIKSILNPRGERGGRGGFPHRPLRGDRKEPRLPKNPS